MKKRIVWVLLALLMLLALPLHAVADDTIYSQGYLLYKFEDGGITICRYVGDDEEVVIIPNMIANCPVSKIAAGAFADCPQVKTIYLPDTVMEIEEGAIPTGIHVILDYNLVTDHPDPSAEPIVPAPTGEVVSSGEDTGVTIIDETLLHPENEQTEVITDEDLPTPQPTPEQAETATEPPATPIPQEAETVRPTQAPNESPVAEATANTQPASATAVPQETEIRQEEASKGGSRAWIWIAAGAAVACGAAAGATVALRRKKK